MLAHQSSFSVHKELPLKNGEIYAYREILPNNPLSNKCVILLHSTMLSSNIWRINNFIDKLQPVFADSFIYAPDLRGFGSSSYKFKLTSFFDFVDDIKLFMEAKNVKSALFIGHCLGGFLTQLFASRYPEKVSGMILLDSNTFNHPPALHGDDESDKKTDNQYKNIDFIEDMKENRAYKKIAEMLAKQDKKAIEETLNEFKDLPNFDDLVRDQMRCQNLLEYLQCERQFKGADDTKLVGLRALIINGENDKFIPRDIIGSLVSKIGPSARFVTLENQPHVTWLDEDGMKCTIKYIDEFYRTL